MSEELSAGSKSPSFNITTSKGRNVTLEDFQGSNLVIFFYPKDNTPGCTTEALDFTQNFDEFKDSNTQILGISKDSLKKHENFINKHSLGTELGSDESGEMCEAFGVWKEKKNYGKTYMGIERSTFLIDKKGIISKVWRKVRVKGHVEDVLSEAKSLA